MISLLRRSAFSVACLGALSLGVPHAVLAGHGSSGGSSGGSHGGGGGLFSKHHGSSGGSSGGSHGGGGGLFKKHHGSSGGSSGGSHGSSGGSHGSSGGSHGGGLFQGHGSVGGSHGSVGGSHGSVGGSHGSVGGYHAAAPVAAPQGVMLAESGVLNLSVPADARVYLEDQLMTLGGSERRFVTPPIAEGDQFVTNVRVELVRDGKVVTEALEARVNPGQELNLAVSFDDAVILAGR